MKTKPPEFHMIKSTLASPEALRDFIKDQARKYGADKVTLNYGYRHTLIYNFYMFQFLFIVNHDMSVADSETAKYELSPKPVTLFEINSLDPTGNHLSAGIGIESGFYDWNDGDAVVDRIIKSPEYRKDGTIKSPDIIHGTTTVLLQLDNDEKLDTWCKVAFKHVIQGWEDGRCPLESETDTGEK